MQYDTAQLKRAAIATKCDLTGVRQHHSGTHWQHMAPYSMQKATYKSSDMDNLSMMERHYSGALQYPAVWERANAN